MTKYTYQENHGRENCSLNEIQEEEKEERRRGKENREEEGGVEIGANAPFMGIPLMTPFF